MDKSKKIIVLDGAIGCGKSSVLNHISNMEDDWLVMQEDVEKWTSYAGVNLLKDFLLCRTDADRERRPRCPDAAFKLQLAVLASFLDRYHQVVSAPQRVVVLESSLFGALHVYTKANADLLTPLESKLLNDLCRPAYHLFEFTATSLLLTCSVLESEARVWRRGRPEDATLPGGYLAKVRKLFGGLAGERGHDGVFDTTSKDTKVVAKEIVDYIKTIIKAKEDPERPRANMTDVDIAKERCIRPPTPPEKGCTQAMPDLLDDGPGGENPASQQV